ncbi:hypothetical protein HZH66_000628 [Vespula vulgaris]|uniref:Uncharacterized protein n=1 Tax=Vespula vulgaris TaxID=7454 RepID=A0A834KTG3_VESVU|nr:hypothetical protein HZH66_000628 [Vespula vulgaris]
MPRDAIKFTNNVTPPTLPPPSSLGTLAPLSLFIACKENALEGYARVVLGREDEIGLIVAMTSVQEDRSIYETIITSTTITTTAAAVSASAITRTTTIQITAAVVAATVAAATAAIATAATTATVATATGGKISRDSKIAIEENVLRRYYS